ncbi:MAG: hypothetical protein EBV06_07240 [Planctomycetia bacterium]|nr:hypothetical protein [Planctomycetia bacterium]
MAKHAKPNKTPPDFQGAIGLNGDAIEGTNVGVPVFRFKEIYSIPAGLVTFGYKVVLFHLLGWVKNTPFGSTER